jgi:predicted lysophospholipase L1 biosynthesis ABC-type transport system permease subunit
VGDTVQITINGQTTSMRVTSIRYEQSNEKE